MRREVTLALTRHEDLDLTYLVPIDAIAVTMPRLRRLSDRLSRLGFPDAILAKTSTTFTLDLEMLSRASQLMLVHGETRSWL